MTPDSQNDDALARLVARAHGGDEQAFADLYEILYPRVLRFVARREKSRDKAQEFVARTFFRFLERLDTFDARRGTVPVFVLSIARNLLIDAVRARRPVVPLHAIEIADQSTPLSTLLRGEELRALGQVLDRLNPSEQELVLLRFGDGLRYGEIAQFLGVREVAIKQRFSRLMRHLQTSVTEALEKGVPS
jgi:RNA polymerase sigma-70 factor (ECF subfamily)